MELIILLAIGIVIGIPTIAIIALVRSRAAERRVEEGWYKTSDLQGDIAGLQRELARLSDRVANLEASPVAPCSEEREVGREATSPVTAIAPAAPEGAKGVPVQFSQPAVASTRIEQATVPLSSRSEAVPMPTASFEVGGQAAPAEITALEEPFQPGLKRLRSLNPFQLCRARRHRQYRPLWYRFPRLRHTSPRCPGKVFFSD